MKKLLGIIGAVAACVVIFSLLFGLLFAMPIEFAVATWHNWRADSTTEGVITRAEVSKARGGLEGSAVSYSYQVGGRHFEGTRYRGGFLSDRSHEAGGGEFAKKHPVGSEVPVYFDSSDPGFSLLEHGWPKWSLGFSAIVWGVWFSGYYSRADPRTKRLVFCYPLSRAATISGFITILAFPITIDGQGLVDFLIIFAVISLLAFGWLMLGKADTGAADSTQS